MADSITFTRAGRRTLWALHRAAAPRPLPATFAVRSVLEPAAFYRHYLDLARLTHGARAPEIAAPGSLQATRDERRLMRAVAAARVGDERLLDNRLYRFALDRSVRRVLAEAVRQWATALAAGLRSPSGPSQENDTMPTPVLAAQTPRSQLELTEAALLWAIRLWVDGRKRGTPCENEVGALFAQLGAPAASPYLCGLMWVLEQAAGRPLTILCPCHPALSTDERSLLDVLSLTQERQDFERLMLLRTLLRPAAARPAGQSATGLVGALNRAGLFLEPCCAPVRMCAYPSA